MIRLGVFVLFSWMFLILAARGLSKDYPCLHFTKDDGLPANTVYHVYRDSKGYIWISTDKGVAKYNGLRFEKFTTLDGLSDNQVFFTQEDYFGRVWFGTYNGKLCFYKDGVFHTEVNTPFLKLPFTAPYIGNILVNKDSSLTINFNDHSALLNIYKDSYLYYPLQSLWNKYKIQTIENTKISPTKFELTGDNAVVDIDMLSKKTDIQWKKRFWTRLYITQSGNYYIDKDYIYTENAIKIRPLQKGFYDRNYINFLYSDGSNFLIGSNNGLFINDTIQIFEKDRISSITQDNEGNYWIGTLNNGLYCLKRNFINTSLIKNCYSGEVSNCYEDADHLFFTATDNNLFTLDHDSVRCIFDYKNLISKKKSYQKNVACGIKKTGPVYRYYDFYDEDYIIIENLVARKSVVHRYENIFPGAFIKAVLPADSTVFIKTGARVYSIDDSSKTDRMKVNGEFVSDSPSFSRIFGFGNTKDNAVLYSTINHVYKIRKGHQIVQRQFGNLSFYKFVISGNYLLGITFDYKLLICNNINGPISIDTVANQNCVWEDFYKLDSNHIIVCTDNQYRLITLDPSDTVVKYSLVTVENPFIPGDAEAICADGINCRFFKNGSISCFELKDLLERPSPPKLFFNFLKTEKSSYPIFHELYIPFAESRNISISFSAISFSSKDVSYQYSVSKNEQDNWRPIKGGYINLYNLGFGEHYIKIRAKSISSGYSEPATFVLHISSPYWATWWFIVLVICGALGLIYLLVRLVVLSILNTREKEHKNKIKLMRAEFKSLNALMNPHFIFNTLNNIQSLFHENDQVGANEYLRVFSDIIRQNMLNISKELISLRKEIELVEKYLVLEKLRFEDQLNYRVNIDEGLDISGIMIPPLLIQPLVENSIKHGILPLDSEDGFIEVNIYELDDILYIEVKDNGVGIEHSKSGKDANHESFGIENIKNRIRQLSIIQGKDITFKISEIRADNGNNAYTIATITIPL